VTKKGKTKSIKTTKKNNMFHLLKRNLKRFKGTQEDRKYRNSKKKNKILNSSKNMKKGPFNSKEIMTYLLLRKTTNDIH
jgi:hypothetical protein